MNVLFLLLLCGVNPPNDVGRTIHIDGYIEINHFWSQIENPPRKIGDIEVAYGKITFDQLLVWRYSPKYDRHDIIYWDMIKVCRERDLLIGQAKPEDKQDAKDKHDAKLLEEWEFAHRNFAKFNNIDTADVVVYLDSPWVGIHDLYNRPLLNGLTNKYEFFIKDSNNNAIKIVVPTLVESETTFDPEIAYKGTRFLSKGNLTKHLPLFFNKKQLK